MSGKGGKNISGKGGKCGKPGMPPCNNNTTRKNKKNSNFFRQDIIILTSSRRSQYEEDQYIDEYETRVPSDFRKRFFEKIEQGYKPHGGLTISEDGDFSQVFIRS
jgi:hypothetical protein